MFLKKSLLALILALGTLQVQAKITIERQDLTTYIQQPDESISIPNNPDNRLVQEADNIAVLIQDNNLSSGNITVNNFAGFAAYYHDLINNPALGGRMFGKVLNLQSGKSQNFSGSRLSAGEAIILKAGDALNISNSVLNAPEIHLISDNVNLDFAAIQNANTVVYIHALSDDAVISIIRIIFNPESSVPYVLNGSIDLKNAVTNIPLVATGAAKVSIQFNAPAFS